MKSVVRQLVNLTHPDVQSRYKEMKIYINDYYKVSTVNIA